jgi:hypothetical protein
MQAKQRVTELSQKSKDRSTWFFFPPALCGAFLLQREQACRMQATCRVREQLETSKHLATISLAQCNVLSLFLRCLFSFWLVVGVATKQDGGGESKPER